MIQGKKGQVVNGPIHIVKGMMDQKWVIVLTVETTRG